MLASLLIVILNSIVFYFAFNASVGIGEDYISPNLLLSLFSIFLFWTLFLLIKIAAPDTSEQRAKNLIIE